MAAYLDVLTDGAVRRMLLNSILICVNSDRPEIQEFGYQPSHGCKDVLEKYGWTGPLTGKADPEKDTFDAALARIKEPRQMTQELEELHDRNDAGVSFVWGHVDSLKVHDYEIDGDRAIAKSALQGEEGTMRFEKDETGWRLDPYSY